jgi:CheY-like chemotaxis protein
MDAETVAHLFEPFFSTKQGHGTGLGLFTVFGIVQRCGGRILVDSAPGAGSTFRIHLPRTEVIAETGASAPAAQPLRPPTETVLVVTPDPQTLMSTSAILAREGYKVLEAANADGALSVVEQFAGNIHLVIADAMMPGTSGESLAAGLALKRARMKVLYLSRYSEPRIVFQQGRCLGFLTKPVVAAALVTKVRDLLDLDGASSVATRPGATP